MKQITSVGSLLVGAFLFITINSSFASSEPPLRAKQPVILPGKGARFDFMEVDPLSQRLLAAHKGAGTLEILDLKSGKPIKAIAVGEAQGIAVDPAEHRYFIGNDGDHNVVVINSKNLEKVSEVKVDGAVDAITFDEKNGMLYAAQDNGDHLWVIDPKASKVISTIAIPGEPEVLEFDSQSDRVYLNIKDKNSIVSINPATNQVESTWSTLPAEKPHGLALDSTRGRAFVAGGNGKLVVLDIKTGKVIGSSDIAPGVDQITYDSDKQLIYSACKGFISITRATDSGLEAVGKVASPKGAHTLSVDPKTHAVWISFSDEKHSYFQKFER